MKTDPAKLDFARRLRREMTPQERHLWYDFLRDAPAKFYKQKPLGSYVLDFYCPSLALALEIDGSQHYENEGMQSDKERTAHLEKRGITVLRFSNADVDERFSAVCEAILQAIEERKR